MAVGYSSGDGRVAPKNGTVEVRKGQIIVTNPEGGGKEAVISCGRGIKLFIDNVEIKGSAPVSEGSRIRAEIEDKQPERKFEINVSKDNMKATVTVHYRDGIKCVLNDRFPASELTVDAISSGKVDCQHYTMEEAKALLSGRGIVFGITESSLSDAIDKCTAGPVVVAEGIEPIDGTNDTIDVKFSDEKKFVEVNNRVDFYSIGKVVAVKPNELLAEKIPGDEGYPGTDVFGNTVAQKKGKRINLTAGRGATISQDGTQVYSQIEGRPEIKGGVVSVHEVYEVQGDVDVSTGNIEFVGDIVVKGNITEGMKVKSGGSVVLYGSVTGGEIMAGGDVMVSKNIIGSKVKAGSNDFLKYSIIECMESIGKLLTAIFSSVETLKNTGKVPKTYRDGQIVKLIIDTRYNQLTPQVIKLRGILAENKDIIPMDTLRVGAGLVKYFTGKGPVLIDDYNILKSYVESIDSQTVILRGELKEPSHITASYVQNSTLSTTGDIKITGKGCYTSELYCKGNVTINKINSVTRGGIISAEGEVKIYELGSIGGALTTVSTGKDSVINCEIAHTNSIIKVGEMSNKLEMSVKNLKAYLYKGELLVEKSRLDE